MPTVLLRKTTLDRIVTGEVDLAFRRWKRPTVKTGGSLRTMVGVVEIAAVERVAVTSITEDDALRAGVELDELLSFLESKADGDVYRVTFGAVGPDPRVALREDDDLTEVNLEDLRARLDRLDRASKRGPWTRECLRLIEANPRVRAQDLADGLGLEKSVFKNDVRKLKVLGLTISHSPGYEVSPRGRAFLVEDR